MNILIYLTCTLLLAVKQGSLHGDPHEYRQHQQRMKRQSGTFTQSSYTFRPVTCVPGVIAGQTTAPGANYFAIADNTPNSNIAVNSNNGQVVLTNYLTPNQAYTATVNTYLTNFKSGSVLGTTTVTVICGGSSGGSQAPVASQPNYLFTISNCNAGASVGTVSVTNSNNVVFGLGSSGSPFLVASNGLITVSQAFTGTRTLTVTATNPYGTTQIPVTIICSSTGGGTGNTVVFPRFNQNLYQFTVTSCAAGTVAGSVAVASPVGGNYALGVSNSVASINPTSGVITLTGSPLLTTTTALPVIFTNSAGIASATVILSPGAGCTLSTMRFSQTAYSFTPTGTQCTTGNVLGTVTVTNAPGVVTYTMTPSVGYTINSAGQIFPPTTGAVSGTFTITAISNGQTATSTVTINTASCTTSTTNCPAWPQSTYTFSSPAGCTAFQTQFFVAAQCIGSTVTYSTPVQAVNNFQIQPVSGQLYATITNTACNILPVVARAQDGTGRTASTTVYINCGTGSCGPGSSSGTTNCSQNPGSFGCGDIG